MDLTNARKRAQPVPMSSMPKIIQRFVKEGIFVASPELTYRRMREHNRDLVTDQKPGGGQNSPVPEVRHLTNIVLAQAAHLPIDAAAAVIALRDLPMTRYEVFVRTEPKYQGNLTPRPAVTWLDTMSGKSLGENLDFMIASCADPVVRDVMPSILGDEWSLTLCADPPFAVITLRTGGEIRRANFGERTTGDQSQRLIRLPFRVITIAGELWQDAIKRRDEITHTEGAALAGATPTADDPRHVRPRAPPVARRTLGRAPGTNNPESSGETNSGFHV